MDKVDKQFLEETKKVRRRNIIIVILVIIILIILYLFGIYVAKLGGFSIPVISSGDTVSQIIKIKENSVEFDEIEDLNIFVNEKYNNKKIIEPDSKSSYTFQIENTLDSNVKYDINFVEKNEHNVNMVYRLKLDNVYVIGNKDTYVGIDELNLKDIRVAGNSINNYTIEWWWESSSNDTEIGKKVYADYKLTIEVLPSYL